MGILLLDTGKKKKGNSELNSTLREIKKKNYWIDLTADQIWQKKAVNSKSLKTEAEENKVQKDCRNMNMKDQ